MKQRKIDVASSKKQVRTTIFSVLNHSKVFLLKIFLVPFVKKVAEHSYEATNLDSSTLATINISSQVTNHEALAVDFLLDKFLQSLFQLYFMFTSCFTHNSYLVSCLIDMIDYLEKTHGFMLG